MAAVTRAEILRLAEMTRVGLSAEEADRLTGEMETILRAVDQLQTVDTTGVTAGPEVLRADSGLRPDVVTPSLTTEDVLANAPDRDGGFFVVPAVFGE